MGLPWRNGRAGLAGRAWLTFALASSAQPAQAHVKWFAPFNVAGAPAALPDVLTDPFPLLLLSSMLAMMLIHVGDRMIAGALPRSAIERWFEPWKPQTPDIMRVTLGAFMLCLWLLGGVLLTPELKTGNPAVSWFQLLLAISTLSWSTAWIAGVGIIILYAVAIAEYGVFHLMDYPLFLGIAAYMIIISRGIERLRPYALSILYVAMAQTLLWASVEKWAFWAWTMPLLAQHNRITFGIDHRTYMVLAGFVEFVTAFLLLYGRASLRLSALFLLIVFLAAIIDFGKIDAVGHAMIIASLAIAIIEGPTHVNRVVQNRIPSHWIGGFEQSLTYLGFLILFFLMYYGLHGLIYGSLA